MRPGWHEMTVSLALELTAKLAIERAAVRHRLQQGCKSVSSTRDTWKTGCLDPKLELLYGQCFTTWAHLRSFHDPAFSARQTYQEDDSSENPLCCFLQAPLIVFGACLITVGSSLVG